MQVACDQEWGSKGWSDTASAAEGHRGWGQLGQPQAGRVPKDHPDPSQSLCQVEQVPIWVQV